MKTIYSHHTVPSYSNLILPNIYTINTENVPNILTLKIFKQDTKSTNLLNIFSLLYIYFVGTLYYCNTCNCTVQEQVLMIQIGFR